MNDSLTILYIEDNADDAYIFQEFVRHIPKLIHIDIKPTLKEGLSAIESNSGYDLILVDLSLPDSRGLQSIEKIIELNSDVPVVALTGYMDKSIALKAIKIGAQDYLMKGDYNEHVLDKTFTYAIERYKIMKNVLIQQVQLEQAQKIAKLGRFEYDVKNDNYQCSKELVHIFDYQEELSLGVKDYWACVHPDDVEVVKQNFVNHLRTQKPFFIDHRIITGNKNIKYIRLSIESFFDDNGWCYRTIGTGQDVTRDYNRNELLKQSQERLDMAVRAGNIGIFDWDLETSKLVCDEEIYAIYEEEHGKTLNYTEIFVNTLNPETKDQTLFKLDAAIKGKTEMDFQYDIILPSGKHKYIHVIAQFQMRANKVHRMVGMATDVTNRVEADRLRDMFTKKLEREVDLRTKELQITKDELEASLAKEKELSLLKSRFVATASHQFRTPLAVIQSNVELISMLNESSNVELLNKAESRIENEVKRMTNLMDDVLILGKFAANQIPLEFKENDIVTRVKQATQLCESAQSDGRFVEVKVKGNPKLFVFDQNTMDHVLENLLINAFKYSRTQNPELVIEFEENACVISVTDYGIGIPKQDISQLFQTFYRSSNVGDISGTGLGLAIVKDYVTVNGGEVLVESELGKKTVFTVKMPYRQAEHRTQ